MTRDQYGVYEIVLPNNADGTPAIQHNSKVKVLVSTKYFHTPSS